MKTANLYSALLTMSLCSLSPTGVMAKATHLLPKPHSISLAEGAAPFRLGRSVQTDDATETVSYTHLTLPTNREV